MKILHVYAENLRIFSDAIEGTDCRINGTKDIQFMRQSFSSFNARDVLGMIIFAPRLTKNILELVTRFDNFFSFAPKPIVLISDIAQEAFEQGYLKVKYSPLYLVQSIEGTISDVDLNRIMTTFMLSGDIYDLSILYPSKSTTTKRYTPVFSDPAMSPGLRELLNTIERE